MTLGGKRVRAEAVAPARRKSGPERFDYDCNKNTCTADVFVPFTRRDCHFLSVHVSELGLDLTYMTEGMTCLTGKGRSLGRPQGLLIQTDIDEKIVRP